MTKSKAQMPNETQIQMTNVKSLICALGKSLLKVHTISFSHCDIPSVLLALGFGYCLDIEIWSLGSRACPG
jgi:hypothetical protein